MKLTNSPILVAFLITLTACGGNSGSEPTPAQQPDLVISDPNNNPGGLSNDPVSVDPIVVTEPAPIIPEPIQQPTNPTIVTQDPPAPIEPVVAEPVTSQPISTDPEPVEPEPVGAIAPAIQEAEVAEGELSLIHI